MNFSGRASGEGLGAGDICQIKTRTGRFFENKRGAPPSPTTPNEVTKQEGTCGFVMEEVDGGKLDRGPRYRDPPINDGTCALFVVGVFLDV